MPLYDYQCINCKAEFEEFRHIEERESMTCPHCSSQAKLLISRTKDDWFRPHWNEHISPNGPIYVSTKQQYKELCKRNGVTARCLM